MSGKDINISNSRMTSPLSLKGKVAVALDSSAIADRILTFPHPILKKRSKAVTIIDKSVKNLVAEMKEVLEAANGAGLAAPQIGVLSRVIVVDIGDGPFALINPQIVSKKGKQTVTEACLSIPGFSGLVDRARYVKVKGRDIKGKDIDVNAEELLAQVLQHEIDHLNGELFIDKAYRVVDAASQIDPSIQEAHTRGLSVHSLS